MRSLKLRISSVALLVVFGLVISPASALAVPIQSLNGSTVQSQSFQSNSNISISTELSTGVHTFGWAGQLPVSGGGTGSNTFTAGSVLFSNGTSIIQDNSNFFWDDTNNRLGIGTTSPTSTLSVNGDTSITGNLTVTGNITGSITATNLIPYTGAISNVNLGAHSLTTAKLISNSDATINSLTVGAGGDGTQLSNAALGFNALLNNTTGRNNVAIGTDALRTTNTDNNTAIGNSALGGISYSGEQNTAVGSAALKSSTTGSYNTALGFRALETNTSGIRNVAVGMGALSGNTNGSNNVAIGFSSLPNNTAGANVAIGDLSAVSLMGGGGNVVIGTAAAIHQADGNTALTLAGGGVYIGNSVRGYDNNDLNSIVIGTSAIGAGANKTVIGNSAMTDIYFGSVSGAANTHAKKMFLGSSSTPGCIIMGDTAGGVSYVTLDSGVLTVSTTPPSECQ